MRLMVIGGIIVLGLGLVLRWLLAGPPMMLLAFSTYANRPVVLTGFAINGQSGLPFLPLVVDGQADLTPRRTGGGALLSYPKGQADRLALEFTWVELFSGRAYAASVEVAAHEMTRSGTGAIDFMPVFAPGGLLIITSDPVSQPQTHGPERDLARVCGQRQPTDDHDYSVNPNALPGLVEALARLNSTPFLAECSD